MILTEELCPAMRWQRSRRRNHGWTRSRERGTGTGSGSRGRIEIPGGQPYKRAFGEPGAKGQSRFTDPESSFTKTSSEGFQQCTNAQVAIGGKKQVVVGRGAANHGQLLADAGHCNEADLGAPEARRIRGHVAPGREGRKHTAIDRDRRPATHRMGEHLATPQGRASCSEGRWSSEAPNKRIKEVLGFRRFHVRGQNKVQGEWSLICLALNIRRMSGLATV